MRTSPGKYLLTVHLAVSDYLDTFTRFKYKLSSQSYAKGRFRQDAQIRSYFRLITGGVCTYFQSMQFQKCSYSFIVECKWVTVGSTGRRFNPQLNIAVKDSINSSCPKMALHNGSCSSSLKLFRRAELVRIALRPRAPKHSKLLAGYVDSHW